jgi:hypothetical protein
MEKKDGSNVVEVGFVLEGNENPEIIKSHNQNDAIIHSEQQDFSLNLEFEAHFIEDCYGIIVDNTADFD